MTDSMSSTDDRSMSAFAEPLAREDAELWISRAARLLEQAVSGMEDDDQIPTVAAALDALRIAYGELSPEEMDGYRFPGEESPGDCICPPDLLARGGFKGGCPVHG